MTVGALVIRPLEERPEAATELAAWFADEWPEYHRGRSLPDIASRFRLVPDVQETLIAEYDGELVGCVSLRGRWEFAPEIDPPWLGGFYVIADRRGQGIGNALVATAVERARREGYKAVHISIRVDPGSYLERGWQMVGTVSAGSENVTVLRYDLGA